MFVLLFSFWFEFLVFLFVLVEIMDFLPFKDLTNDATTLRGGSQDKTVGTWPIDLRCKVNHFNITDILTTNDKNTRVTVSDFLTVTNLSTQGLNINPTYNHGVFLFNHFFNLNFKTGEEIDQDGNYSIN